jgi:SAM-dependent methyltransferase
MSDVWSDRAELYRQSAIHSAGDDLDLVVEWCEPGDVAASGCDVEHLPFADDSFDAVASRLAAHHFPDVLGALKEMARVARSRVVICDNTFVSETSEVADRLRDPSHVRNYGVAEWESFFELAGLEIVEQRHLERPLEIEPWLSRTQTPAADAARVREFLGDRIVDGWMNLPTLVIKGTTRA